MQTHVETLRCPQSAAGATVGKVPLGRSEVPHPLAAGCPSQCPASPPASPPPQMQQEGRSSHGAESCGFLKLFPAASTFSLVFLWLRAAPPLLFTRRVRAFQVSYHHLPCTKTVCDGRTQDWRPPLCPPFHTRSLPGKDGNEGQVGLTSAVGMGVCHEEKREESITPSAARRAVLCLPLRFLIASGLEAVPAAVPLGACANERSELPPPGTHWF